MKKRLLAVTTLSLTLALGAAGPAAAHEGHPFPPTRTSENASCLGAISTILAQVKFRDDVNVPQQGMSSPQDGLTVSELAQRKGSTPAECFGPQG